MSIWKKEEIVWRRGSTYLVETNRIEHEAEVHPCDRDIGNSWEPKKLPKRDVFGSRITGSVGDKTDESSNGEVEAGQCSGCVWKKRSEIWSCRSRKRKRDLTEGESVAIIGHEVFISHDNSNGAHNVHTPCSKVWNGRGFLFALHLLLLLRGRGVDLNNRREGKRSFCFGRF